MLSPDQNQSGPRVPEEQKVATALVDLFGKDAVRDHFFELLDSSSQGAAAARQFIETLPSNKLSTENHAVLQKYAAQIAQYLGEDRTKIEVNLLCRMTAGVIQNDSSGERLEALLKEKWPEYPGRPDALKKFLDKMRTDDPFEAATMAQPLTSIGRDKAAPGGESVLSDATGSPMTAHDYLRFQRRDNPEAEVYRCGPDAAASVVGHFHLKPEIAELYQKDPDERDRDKSSSLLKDFQQGVLHALFDPEEIDVLREKSKHDLQDALREESTGKRRSSDTVRYRDLERREALLQEVNQFLEESLPLRDHLESEARGILGQIARTGGSAVDTGSTGQTLGWLRKELKKTNRILPPVADQIYVNLTNAEQLGLSKSEVSLLYRAALSLQASFSWVNARLELRDLKSDIETYEARGHLVRPEDEPTGPDIPEYLLQYIQAHEERALTQAQAKDLLFQSERILEFREEEGRRLLFTKKGPYGLHLEELALVLQELEPLYFHEDGTAIDGNIVSRSFPQARLGESPELGVVVGKQLKESIQPHYEALQLCGLNPSDLQQLAQFPAESEALQSQLRKFLRIHSVEDFETLTFEALKTGRIMRAYFGGVLDSHPDDLRSGMVALKQFLLEGKKHPENGFGKLDQTLPFSRARKDVPKAKDLVLLETAEDKLEHEGVHLFQEEFEDHFGVPRHHQIIADILKPFSHYELTRFGINPERAERVMAGLVTTEDFEELPNIYEALLRFHDRAPYERALGLAKTVAESVTLSSSPQFGPRPEPAPDRPYLHEDELERALQLAIISPEIERREAQLYTQEEEKAEVEKVLSELKTGGHILYPGGFDPAPATNRKTGETFYRPQFTLRGSESFQFSRLLVDEIESGNRTFHIYRPDDLLSFLRDHNREDPYPGGSKKPDQPWYRLDLLGNEIKDAILFFSTYQGFDAMRGGKVSIEQPDGKTSKTILVESTKKTFGVSREIDRAAKGEEASQQRSYGRNQPKDLAHCWVSRELIDAVLQLQSLVEK